ncbi:chromosome partitioning protein ParB [Paraburkholderia hospita]|nr:ParB/Srx family N-terminal domain-containing protein [Paraburkholderia hospita]OUL82244.1 chromosome partitioning protein ParB [Paraburkholderia hospita]
MQMLEIGALRSTQGTHGRREVVKKADAYRALDAAALQDAIAEKPVPVVHGYGGEYFATDHHHVAAALHLVGVGTVPIVIVADLSALSEADFWLSMENRHWVSPFDACGNRIAFRQLPRRVWESQEDDFRDLAADARDAGGYAKTDVPLADFRWAAFFRRYLPGHLLEAEYGARIEQAAALARTGLAVGLPGYLGESRGHSPN